jgi:NAD(P)-dependent dehydrogenase (short-subunit alcohol dehydrogenase family)
MHAMTQGQDVMHTPTRGDRVAGKVAIVTGGGSVAEGIGNGRAAAILLAGHGANVALMDRIRPAAEDTAAVISAKRLS